MGKNCKDEGLADTARTAGGCRTSQGCRDEQEERGLLGAQAPAVRQGLAEGARLCMTALPFSGRPLLLSASRHSSYSLF